MIRTELRRWLDEHATADQVAVDLLTAVTAAVDEVSLHHDRHGTSVLLRRSRHAPAREP